MLRFVQTLPKDDLIAVLPQHRGRRAFRGDNGMALHNYLALYHKHRFVHGQSSWQPPVTDLALRAVHSLPADGARRALLSIGARHLVLFAEELSQAQRHLRDQLVARPEQYRLVFEQGSHSVFTLLDHDEQPLADDAANVALFLDALAPEVMPVDGHRPDRAVLAATRLLTQAGRSGGDILLISHEADAAAIAAAARAASQGFRVSALGLGTGSGATFRARDGGLRTSGLDQASLQRLADAGGGRYASLYALQSAGGEPREPA